MLLNHLTKKPKQKMYQSGVKTNLLMMVGLKQITHMSIIRSDKVIAGIKQMTPNQIKIVLIGAIKRTRLKVGETNKNHNPNLLVKKGQKELIQTKN